MELKSFIVLYNGKFIRVYKENEADRYIAELQSANQLEIDEWYNKLMCQKYKRCLAMAGYCATKCVESQYTHKSYFTHKSEFRIGHYRKWYKRWLKIADQLNPNSTATKENSNG